MDYLKIAQSFSILHRQSQAFAVHACQELGLTYTEYIILLYVCRAEGCKQDELCSALKLDKAAAARGLRLLEEKKLIVRRENKNDRRMKRIYFSPIGKKQKQLIEGSIACWIDYLSENMSKEMADTIEEWFNAMAAKAREADFAAIEGREE